MTTFKQIAINDTFSFPEPAVGYGGARLGLCVKLSARRYQAIGRPEVYTVGTTAVEVVARGELEPVTRIAYRAERGLLA
jgi:hypothetical protein